MELEQLPGAPDLGDGLGQGSAFLAGQQVPQLITPDEKFRAGPVEDLAPGCPGTGPQPSAAWAAAATAARA